VSAKMGSTAGAGLTASTTGCTGAGGATGAGAGCGATGSGGTNATGAGAGCTGTGGASCTRAGCFVRCEAIASKDRAIECRSDSRGIENLLGFRWVDGNAVFSKPGDKLSEHITGRTVLFSPLDEGTSHTGVNPCADIVDELVCHVGRLFVNVLELYHGCMAQCQLITEIQHGW